MFEPLAAQQTAGAVLILAAAGALVLAWLSLRAAPRGLLVVGGLFVVSLSARAFLVAYFATVIAATWRARTRLRRDALVVVLGGTGLAIGLRVVGAPASPPLGGPPVAAPKDPRASVEAWQARDNPWRARGVALAWARAEKDAPGEGYATLAQLDWNLGERDKARRVLQHLLERTADRDVLERARRLRQDWGDP